MLTIFDDPAVCTVAEFSQLQSTALETGHQEGVIDADITFDHGLPLDDWTAEDCLLESDTFQRILNSDIKKAYAAGFLAGFLRENT